MEKLVVPLYLVDHLAVNVFYVEVLSRHDEGASSHSCVESQASCSDLVNA